MILDFSYDANGNPVSLAHCQSPTSNPAYYYYGTNSRGDVEVLYSSTGAITALYEYDAYGNVTAKSTNGQEITGETHIANLNPLRYRGYVYDTETGLYYLQSRYYDPTTCRFVNGDAFTSTGVGLTGNNLFTYCNNNSVMFCDSYGAKPAASTVVGLETPYENLVTYAYMNNRKLPTDTGASPNYKPMGTTTSDSNNILRNENPNCYSYAIGYYNKSYDPGDFSGTSFDLDVYSVGNAVMMDFIELSRGCRMIESYNSTINSNEYRIALRTSDVYRSIDADGELQVVWDYHFMVQTRSGQWAEKHGPGGATVLHSSGNPDTISWDWDEYKGFYTSDILYFAITN